MRDSITVHKMVKYHLPRSDQKDTPLLCQIFVAISHHKNFIAPVSHDLISPESINYSLVKRLFQHGLSIEPNCHANGPSDHIAAATHLRGKKISHHPRIYDNCSSEGRMIVRSFSNFAIQAMNFCKLTKLNYNLIVQRQRLIKSATSLCKLTSPQ